MVKKHDDLASELDAALDSAPGVFAVPDSQSKATETSEAGPAASHEEIKKSGKESGRPERKKSRKEDLTEDEDEDDYLSTVYGGDTDPDKDLKKANTNLPLYLIMARKAIAPMEGMTVQELDAAILRGDKPSLKKLQPEIVEKFYRLAKQGKLKR